MWITQSLCFPQTLGTLLDSDKAPLLLPHLGSEAGAIGKSWEEQQSSTAKLAALLKMDWQNMETSEQKELNEDNYIW